MLFRSDGECVCLKSPSGGGKTTVFRLVAGLEKPQSGQVLAPQKLAVVFQEDRLLPHMTLKSNVILPLKKSQYKKAVELLKEVGLGSFLNTPISKLSGGMKRRAAIIRAIAFEGEALLLDEPFNGIDLENKRVLAEIIKREVLSKNIPVLISTHIREDAELLSAKTSELSF